MEECEPLAWAVQSIYEEQQDENQEGNTEETADWVLVLSAKAFQEQIVPEISEWFDSPPNWDYEDDYLPMEASAQGAAMEFFESMDGETLDILGVKIVEGEHPGSTYYAADIPVRFKRQKIAAMTSPYCNPEEVFELVTAFERECMTDVPRHRPTGKRRPFPPPPHLG